MQIKYNNIQIKGPKFMEVKWFAPVPKLLNNIVKACTQVHESKFSSLSMFPFYPGKSQKSNNYIWVISESNFDFLLITVVKGIIDHR